MPNGAFFLSEDSPQEKVLVQLLYRGSMDWRWRNLYQIGTRMKQVIICATAFQAHAVYCGTS